MTLARLNHLYPTCQVLGKVLITFLCAASLQAVADEDVDLLDFYDDDETVSISTGTNKPIRLAPSVATVITEDDISRSGAKNLDQVLEAIPGVHVSVAKNNKLNSVYSIRGVHTARNAQVLVLIDDVPVRQLYGGGRPSNFYLPVENIKRVEIVRGPGSALYGADAFSGVINVVTKGAVEIDGFRFGLRSGSFNSQDVWLQYGTQLDSKWQLALSLEHSKSDGDDGRIIERDFQSIFDDVFGSTASLAPGALDTRFEVTNFRAGLRSENWDFSVVSWLQNDAGLGNGVAQALDPIGSVDVDYHVLSAAYSADVSDTRSVSMKAWTSYYNELDEAVILPPGSIIPIGDDGNLTLGGRLVSFPDGFIGNPGGRERRYSLEAATILTGLPKHSFRLAAGLELQRGEVREEKNFGPGVIDGTESVVTGALTDVTGTDQVYADIENREIYFASVQDSWSLRKDWEATIGLRYDWYSDVGGTLNPRAAIVWATSYSLTTKLLYGRAFRAPSFAELFAINNPVILGNRDLSPETMDTVELAFDYRASTDLTAKVNFFWYKIEDAIEFVAAAGGSIAENASTQDGTGFEFEVTWSGFEKLELHANYSMQFAEMAETGERVADAPGRQMTVIANYQYSDNWNFNVAGNWVADRRRGSADLRPQLDDYSTLDLSVRYSRFLGVVDISLTGRNILNDDAREGSVSGLFVAIPDDLPLEGRSLNLEFSTRF